MQAEVYLGLPNKEVTVVSSAGSILQVAENDLHNGYYNVEVPEEGATFTVFVPDYPPMSFTATPPAATQSRLAESTQDILAAIAGIHIPAPSEPVSAETIAQAVWQWAERVITGGGIDSDGVIVAVESVVNAINAKLSPNAQIVVISRVDESGTVWTRQGDDCPLGVLSWSYTKRLLTPTDTVTAKVMRRNTSVEIINKACLVSNPGTPDQAINLVLDDAETGRLTEPLYEYRLVVQQGTDTFTDGTGDWISLK